MDDNSWVSTESVGRALTGTYTKLDNINEHGEGEICMGGRHVFMGYLGAPDKTAEAKDKDGWLHSGDIGRMESNCHLYITGKSTFFRIYHIAARYTESNRIV